MTGRKAGLPLLLSVLAVIPGVTTGGCDKKPQPIPAGSFRAVVEDVVEDDLVLVKRITITAAGNRSVRIAEQSTVREISGDPDSQTGHMTAQVVLVADLITTQTPSESTLRWLVRMTSSGSTGGGTGLRPAGSAGSLRDLLSFRLDSGDHPLSRDITLGYLQDHELILRVE